MNKKTVKYDRNSILDYVFMPDFWQIDFFDEDTRNEWYKEYQTVLKILRVCYPELGHWADLQLVLAYEEYLYLFPPINTPSYLRHPEFLAYLFLYQKAGIRPRANDLPKIKKLLPELWEKHGSKKIIETT